MVDTRPAKGLAVREGRWMIYELREYDAMPGRMPALLKRFETHTLRIWDRLEIRQLGFWTVIVGPSQLKLIYMLAWESMTERDEKWSAFSADPEWHQVLAESEEDGIIVGCAQNILLKPTAFSALQ